jgi:hypothetical protein
MLIPDDMDVPLIRKDTSKNENVRWLLRNLAIRNSNHPDFKTIIKTLQTLDPKALVIE